MATTYKTTGKTQLISFFSSHPDTQYTVDELHAALTEAYPDAYTGKGGGKSSLYRRLAALIEEKTGVKPLVTIMGPVIGSHVGPGSVSCGWISTKTRDELLSKVSN